MHHITHNTTPQNHTISWCFPCLDSNGKEKDWESSFHYYGARYYWSEVLTGWLSVDPMVDKYPSISPYAYCAWNPVKLVDPDGRDVWEVSKDGHVQRSGDEGGKKKQIVKYANGNTPIDKITTAYLQKFIQYL